MVRIITDRRKYSSCYMFLANGREIKLWSCYQHRDIKQIISKEGSDYGRRDFLKRLEAIEEISYHHQKDHRIVKEVTHIERFIDPYLRETQTGPYGKLPAGYLLLGWGEDMVEIGKDAIGLKCVRVSVREQRHLDSYTDKSREFTRYRPVKIY